MYVPLGLGLGQKEAEQKIWEWTSEPRSITGNNRCVHPPALQNALKNTIESAEFEHLWQWCAVWLLNNL